MFFWFWHINSCLASPAPTKDLSSKFNSIAFGLEAPHFELKLPLALCVLLPKLMIVETD